MYLCGTDVRHAKERSDEESRHGCRLTKSFIGDSSLTLRMTGDVLKMAEDVLKMAEDVTGKCLV